MPTDSPNKASTARRLILASASPRRHALLREHGYAFDVVKPPLDEPDHLAPGLPAPQLAEALSYFKAKCVADQIDEGVVIGGDTVVSLKNDVLGKPKDREDAQRIIESLAGTTHHVITAITLLDAATGARLIGYDTTAVMMRSLTEDEIDVYLNTGQWEGKAGAYGIQDQGDAFVERIEGSFTNVVGMPVGLATGMLHQWGIVPRSKRVNRG